MSTHSRSGRNRGRAEGGFGLLLTLFGIGMMVLTLGAAIDFSHIYLVKGELQGIVDEAALRAAGELDGSFEGIERVRRALERELHAEEQARFSLSTDNLVDLRVEFAREPDGNWRQVPNPADGYRYVKVVAAAEARLFFLPMLPDGPRAQTVTVAAVAGQSPVDVERLPPAAFSVTAAEPADPEFGFVAGRRYKLETTGKRGCEETLARRYRRDTDMGSAAYGEYRHQGNGQRVLFVPVRSGAEASQTAVATFLIPPDAVESGVCEATYVGAAPVLGAWRNGGGAPGLYELRLIQ